MRLTLPQKQIYYMEMFNKDAINVNCGSVLLDKLYSVETVKKAINEVFRINEALRTRLCLESGEPSQYVCEYEEQDIEVLHFGSRDEVHKYGNKQAQLPMDLSEALCEIKVISSDEFCGVFYKMHHIISDAVTFSLISSQIHKLLEGIPVEAFPYSDYVAEEEKYIMSPRAQKDKAFFLDRHNEMGELIHLSDSLPGRGKSERFLGVTDKSLSLKIKELAKRTDVSVYIVFLTLISTYIAKSKNYSGDFYIGTPILNRSSFNQMNTAGMFINNVPFPVKIAEKETFEFNLKNTKDMFFKILKHQKFNYVCAINELNIDPSYDVSFSFQNSSIYGENFKSTWYHNKVQSESLQIHIDDRDNEGVFNISYDYQIDKFTQEDIKKLHKHLCNLLLDIIENPAKELYALDMLSSQETQKLLYDFNDTYADYPRNKCVHHLFEEQVTKAPDLIAVTACDKTLTYKELNEEANKIAHSLIEKGISKGDIVGLMLHRRSCLLSAMIGIIKSGAAYLPIDPDFPQGRIEYMLSDSNAKYCITDENIGTLLDNTLTENVCSAVEGADNCYCIYTSGSTGKPKGVLIRHQNILNYCNNNPINNLQNYISRACSAVLACGSIIFDISNSEIFLSLLLNKSIVLANEQEISNANSLARLINKNQIDCIHCTPTKLLAYFESSEFTSSFKNIKCAMIAGETFTSKIYDTVCQFSNVQVFNGYGPTETTMGVSFGEVNKYGITIGKPIANTKIYITDKYLNLVPVGVTGELCIAGDGVGAGYLNNPELTAEKFTDNPFGEGKLYKTGDLAYWREDGNIVFVGRNDFQVKIRGLRIELGEIENALLNIGGIKQSAVIVRTDSEDRQIICAFYTGEEKPAKTIRDIIGEKLPKYMIPHILSHLEEMPLTPSGKINRKALSTVELENIEAATEFVAPITEEEKALADAVSSVLNTASLNMLDNFFDLGGDSIKAIYVVSKLEEMGYELRVSDIMQIDTLSKIAGVIKQRSATEAYEQNEVNGFVPFSPIMRVYLEENREIRKDFVHNCIISADCDAKTARKALDALVSHHDILRGAFCNSGIEVLSSDEREAYSFNEIDIADTDEAIEHLTRKSIGDKLIDVVFCKTAERNLIGITVHHFLIDLVSWEILTKDFRTAVNQIKNGGKISIPSKTASFRQWIEKLEAYSETISEEAKEYWKKTNERLDTVKTLFSSDDPENETEFYSYSFDKELTGKLINKANNSYGTRTNELILTALGLAAGKIVDGAVGISVESHGRAELDNPIAIDRTVGWFTSCYPVIINNNSDAAEELISVKESLRKIPRSGIDYLLLSYGLHNNANIIFNFYQNSIAEGEIISFNPGTSAFCNKISVDCFIIDGVLTTEISIPYCNHRKHLAEDLGEEFRRCLVKLIDICSETDAVIKTCSDFSDDKLTEAELAELKALYDPTDSGNIKDIYSLTPAQEGIYAQYFRNTDTKTYQLQSLCRISKAVDINKLGKSAQLLSLRHEVLKTSFTPLKSSGAIKQVILESRKPVFRVIKNTNNFSESLLDEIIAEEDAGVFCLQNDSLLRVTVIDFDDDRFMLIQTHHIIIDGWCLPVIINDLQRYYGKLSEGISEEALIHEIRRETLLQSSYAGYSEWIRRCDKKESEEYWKHLLADSTVSHIFSREKTDNSQNEDFATFITPLNEAAVKNVHRISKENRVSHNTVFESAFAVALQKYSGSNETVFDKVISGRGIPLKNIDKTVGLFINTVPVRISTNENTTLSDLSKEIQKQTVNADKYGILPLAQVYKMCGIDSKSVDALFVFENYYTGDGSEIENGALTPEFVTFEEQTGFNLTLTIIKEGNSYVLRTSYAVEMYTEREVSEFIRGYISILEASLDTSSKIKDISIADTELLDSFNKTAHTYEFSPKATLYSLFENTARKQSSEICIKTAEREMTFSDLLDISERLDSEIRKITNGKKSVIAVIAERSPEMYGAIYGIIRGGNAYLPIDPSYPTERIEYILSNSNAAAVVCQGKLIHLAGNTHCINMTELIGSPEKPANILPCAADENDTAYIIYTSGSTGTPKGAKVSHKSAVNRIMWMHDKYPLGSNGVILQKTPYTFDVSVWELFWWGMFGGCLAAAKPGEHFLPAKILDEASKNKVTHIHFVPSVFELFLNYLETHTEEAYKFESVKYVFLSGEALTSNLISRFYKMYDIKKVTLHNLYGPTECAVDVTYYDCKPDDTDPVPIGKPIYNTQIHIVDKYMNPVPAGVQGELCIAGVNVGQGYLNNEKLTNESFIANPFGEGRLYRTGDLAYWREDGQIIFCGRKDSQIKLNGLRIEIGEIEAVIGQLPQIESVAVVVNKNAAKDALVAFYCGENNAEDLIKTTASAKLPKYMVPSVVVQLGKMPINQSGKLNRKILSEYKINATQNADNQKPINDIEENICRAFEKILDTKNLSRNSDFFEMGGTSLSMISFLSEKDFESITAAEFMKNPTPAELARLLQHKSKEKFEYLKELYLPEDAKTALILLPFAGGGAEAYSSLVHCLKKAQKDMAVYFVPYLHSFIECEKTAKEIAAALSGRNIYVYSHCVGSALALHILKHLSEEGVAVKHYFAGASIPPVIAVKKNIWNIVPDSTIRALLKKAGADLKDMPYNRTKKLLADFRQDTDFANIAFFEFNGRLNIPLSVIISKNDIFTPNYRKAEKCWLKYFTKLQSISFIETTSHYFQSDNAQALANIILKKS